MADSNALTVQQRKMVDLASWLNSRVGSIRAIAATHMTPERTLKIVQNAISREPKLLECTKESILTAVVQASTLGLEPCTPAGEFYLIPFKNSKTGVSDALGVPGYRGLIKLARWSGEIAMLSAEAVFDKDEFECELGLEQRLVHRPNWDTDDRENPENLTKVYAVAKFHDGSYQFIVMTRRQIEAIRMRSRAANYGPWVTDYVEMAKKTAIRRLAKYLPLSSEKFHTAIKAQEAAESGEVPDVIIDTEGNVVESSEAKPEPTTGAAGLKATLTKATKKPAPPTLDDARNAALQKLVKAYEAIEIVNQDEQEADFARRTGGTMLEDATVAEIEAVITSINAEFDKRNA